MGKVKCGICGKWTTHGVETGNYNSNGMKEYAHKECLEASREEQE